MPHRVNSSDSFSFASSIKCCVGVQPKKKKHHHHHRTHQKHKISSNSSSNSGSNAWVSLASVKSQNLHLSPAYRNSSQSAASCPYITPAATVRSAPPHKRSNGYTSELEASRSAATPPRQNSSSANYESESDDDSDSDFARAAGSRGKSAGSVMMKLAKRFSKKNLTIAREEGDTDSLDEREADTGSSWNYKQRSNSVSNLDAVEG